MASRRVALLYADHVGASMGGVGIRAVELARVLQRHVEVELVVASHDGVDLEVPVRTFSPHDARTVRPALAGATAVVAQPQWPSVMSVLRRSGARLVLDLYDPEVFGTMEHFSGRGVARRLMTAFAVDRVLDALRSGHHVACANERQRDLWIGALLAAGLVTPGTYDQDPSLRQRLDVVAYGVPDQPARRSSGPPLTDRVGLARSAEVVLWNGGVWSWLDPLTPVRAMALLAERRPTAHLVFMGSSSAPPAVRAAAAARKVAGELGVLGRNVHFHEDWVPYDERADWLLDASCAVSAHGDHLEARFSSRTRLIDCLWARLPIVCTEGDDFAERVRHHDLGAVTAPGDASDTAHAIERVLDGGRRRFAPALAQAAEELSWSAVAEPLVRWVMDDQPRATSSPPARRPAELARSLAYRTAAVVPRSLRREPPRLG